MGLGCEWILYCDWNRSRAHAGNDDRLPHGAAARLSQLCDCLRRYYKNWSDTSARCREQRITLNFAFANSYRTLIPVKECLVFSMERTNYMRLLFALLLSCIAAAQNPSSAEAVTIIRDVETEGAGYGDIGIKQAIEGGFIPGPRMFVVTRAISTTGGYPLEGYAPEIEVPKGAQLIDGPVEARKAAREQLDHGADWIKVYMTHRSWVDEQGKLHSQPTLTLDEIKAVVDEAHGWGKKVACHAYNGLGLHRALDGGCDSIEHGLELDDAAVSQMLKQGTWFVPTLSVYYYWWEPENTDGGKRDRARANVHGPSFTKALKAGVKMAFGTDVGGFPWKDSIAQEFAYMVKFGMTPMQAIQAATARAAELLDMQGKLGVIAPGAYAD